MNESSTLVYLVKQIKAEFIESCLSSKKEIDSELSDSSYCADYAPSSRSVRAILDYSRLLEVSETESMGKVEFLLN